MRRVLGLGFAVLLTITVGDVAAAQHQNEMISAQPLALTQIKVGNVFLQGEPVEIGLATTATTATTDGILRWRVRDYWGAEVASGRTPVNESTGRLRLPVHELGYYTLDTAVESDGVVLGETATSFSILEPFDFEVDQTAPYGMNIHFWQWTENRPQLINLMKQAGVQNIRDGVTWGVVEPQPGVYDWSRYAEIMREIRESGLNALMILGLYNRHYAGGCMPWTVNAQQAFAEYARAVQNHYNWVEWFEVWNEWDIAFQNPAGCADYSEASRYGTLLGATHNRLPAGSVVGGATSWIPVGWFRDLFETGALASMDKVSVHPYLKGPPSEPQLGTRMGELKTLMSQHGGAKPVWITEQGWSTCDPVLLPDRGCVSEQTQANYIVQAHVRALGPLEVAKYFWYDFMDNGVKPDNWNHGVGIIRYDRTQKPSYTAYSNMTRQLTGAKFVRSEQLGEGIHSYVFARDGVEKRVIWSTGEHRLAVDAAAPVTVTNIMGGAQSYTQDALSTLEISSEPIYVTGNGVELALVEKSTPALLAR